MSGSEAGPTVYARDWHAKPAGAVLAAVASSRAGLTEDEAARRLETEGRNEITREAEATPWRVLAGQFTSPIIWLLGVAALVAGVIGDAGDAWAILAIVIVNAAIGFHEEWGAERSLAALRQMTAPQARVRRGSVRMIPAAELVRGDIVELEGGDLVPADGRILESAELRVVEAALTGESEPVTKTGDPAPEDAPLAERRSMTFMGTAVAAGAASIVVVATGMRTELGRIATMLRETERGAPTPLQRRLQALGKVLSLGSLAIVALVFGAGLVRGIPAGEMFLTSVSLAVAAVPEGLPAVVTVALAVGVKVMARRRALVRRLHAVETLGAINVICSDKTGTLTVGQMTVRAIAIGGTEIAVSGEGYAPQGVFSVAGRESAPSEIPLLGRVLSIAAACNGARLVHDRDGWSVAGDPTEGALLAAAAKAGIDREALDVAEPALRVVPFDSTRKRMTVVRKSPAGARAYVKGAPDVILGLCSRVAGPDGPRSLDEATRETILAENGGLARRALRVLAVAWKDADSASATADDLERDLIFAGLIGMQDPPRAEAAEAVRRCRHAGIRVVMITGDQAATAAAIARELDILEPGDRVVSGRELDAIDEGELARLVPQGAVYARVTAAHKLRLVRAWRAAGGVVAMTGDGVNDAPALKGADIGIAMGRTGTEVTKAASDVVITDDRFASIVDAVEQGRGIYDNIRKTLQYLLAGNFGELILVAAAVVTALPVPLLPIHLLWINLVTDGIPALCLAVDRVDPNVMRRKPRLRDQGFIDAPFIGWMLLTGTLIASVSLGAFLFALRSGDVAVARAHAFAVLVYAELFRSLGSRSETRPVWQLGLRSNWRLVLVVAISMAVQIWSQHGAMLRGFLKVPELPWAHTIALLALGMLPFLTLEVVKLVRRSTLRLR